jgi:DNA-directed RNA polymerase delta subunit
MAENKEKIIKNKLEAVDLGRLIFNMIKKLPERSGNIIIKRFNLDNKGIQTLDEIGREYNITRERVRQIEVEAIAKLKKISGEYNLDEVFNYLKEIIESRGGVMSEEKITSVLFNDDGNFKANKQIALLILSLDDKIKIAKETKIYEKIYFYEKENVLKFEKIIKKLENYLKEKNKNIDFDKIIKLINESVKEYNIPDISVKAIESYLGANKIILKNILGEWGSEKWPRINPKNIRDKAYLSLRKNKKPLHFTKIADEINIIWPKKKKTNNQTVHNELIKDNRFVLVGRGIYALKEWGYKQGTVLDVIIEIMKEKNKNIKQEEIIEEVLKKRQVKKNTIILNLQNKKYVEKLNGKIYRLK